MLRGLARQVITPPAVIRAREGIASRWVEEFGRSGRALALPLGVQPAAWRRALEKAGEETQGATGPLPVPFRRIDCLELLWLTCFPMWPGLE